MPSLSTYLGVLLTVSATFCVFFNILMLIILWRGSFLSSKNGGIYCLAFAQIAGGMVTPSLLAIYLGPSIIAQSTLFETLNVPQIIGFIFHCQWFQDMLLQAVVAINRWLVIVYPNTSSSAFTKSKTIGLVGIVSFISLLLGVLTSYVLPCCPIYFHYKFYSVVYLRNDFNIADYFVDLPINISCSLIAIFCYWRIYIHIKTSHTQISNILNKSENESRKIRQTRLALQFAVCTGFCILGWIGFRVLPLIFAFSPETFLAVTFSAMCHCISTSFIFFAFNTDIKQRLFAPPLTSLPVPYHLRGSHDFASTQASGAL